VERGSRSDDACEQSAEEVELLCAREIDQRAGVGADEHRSSALVKKTELFPMSDPG
jgi:hypothetical protein